MAPVRDHDALIHLRMCQELGGLPLLIDCGFYSLYFRTYVALSIHAMMRDLHSNVNPKPKFEPTVDGLLLRHLHFGPIPDRLQLLATTRTYVSMPCNVHADTSISEMPEKAIPMLIMPPGHQPLARRAAGDFDSRRRVLLRLFRRNMNCRRQIFVGLSCCGSASHLRNFAARMRRREGSLYRR